jgi:hypothetical protein
MLVVPRVTQSSQDRLAKALGRQQSTCPRAWPPPQQRPNDAEIGKGIDPERCDNAIAGYGQATERWTDGAGNIHADAVRGDRGWQVVLRHEIGHDRLPRRYRHRASRANQECEHKQVRGGRPAQPNNHRVNRRNDRRDTFNHNQKLALVENVGERAGWNCEQANRQTGRRLHQRYDQRIRIKRGHQPAGRRAVHPAADI